MATSVAVSCAALPEVAQECVGFVLTLGAVPVEWRARVVLFVASEAHRGNLRDGVGEVVQAAGGNGDCFAIVGAYRETHERAPYFASHLTPADQLPRSTLRPVGSN